MEVIEKVQNDNNQNIKEINNSNPTLIDDSIQMNEIKLNKNESDKKLEGLKKIEEETSKYVEEMKKGTYNILVAVRCRPLSQKEREISTYETINFIDKKVLILKTLMELIIQIIIDQEKIQWHLILLLIKMIIKK